MRNPDSHDQRTKRIAKNTIILYIRMIVTLFISLFTSRIVLKALGFDDYGLYSVVGGVVTLFSFLRSSMSTATQRFLSYEMGTGNKDKLRDVFCVCLSTHLILALILIILAETLGLWFLNTYINIPTGREFAANWIYQSSVISLCLSIFSLPYVADIVSNERMGFFAFLSILDAFLKLGIAYLVLYTEEDRLILYGSLLIGISALNLLLNWGFCHFKFQESHYRPFWDKAMFRRVFSFSGWTIWGQLSVVGSNHGTNILVNIFHSVAANAAMGVAYQVNTALTGLIANFQTAFKPQITKSYAAGEYQYLTSLTKSTSKISFLLMFVVSLPIMLNIDYLLDIWLDKVPTYAGELCNIFIVAKLCNAISAPLEMNILATGNVKNYQIATSACYILELLFVYFLFKLGLSLVMGVAMKVILNGVILFVRLYYVKYVLQSFPTLGYIKHVLFPLTCVAIIAWGLSYTLINLTGTITLRLIATLMSFVFSLSVVYLVGLKKQERKSLVKLIFKNKRT